MIFCKARSCNDVEDNKFIKFTLSASTYSIDDFNAKVKVAVLQEKQDWKPRQIKGLKLVILEQYRFMASNTFLITLAILDNYLENTSHIKSTLPPCSYKTSLDTSLPPPPPSPRTSLFLYYKQINKVKNEVDGSPSSLLSCIQVSNYKASFAQIHLVFLELTTHHCQLDFKLLDECNNAVIPRTLYIQLLNK